MTRVMGAPSLLMSIISILMISMLVMLHFMAPVSMQAINIDSNLRRIDLASNSTSEARYASKAGLTCLLAIRRRILLTYKPLLQGFTGQIALLDVAAHTNVGGAEHERKLFSDQSSQI